LSQVDLSQGEHLVKEVSWLRALDENVDKLKELKGVQLQTQWIGEMMIWNVRAGRGREGAGGLIISLTLEDHCDSLVDEVGEMSDKKRFEEELIHETFGETKTECSLSPSSIGLAKLPTMRGDNAVKEDLSGEFCLRPLSERREVVPINEEMESMLEHSGDVRRWVHEQVLHELFVSREKQMLEGLSSVGVVTTGAGDDHHEVRIRLAINSFNLVNQFHNLEIGADVSRLALAPSLLLHSLTLLLCNKSRVKNDLRLFP
jgi:hypothetical protein